MRKIPFLGFSFQTQKVVKVQSLTPLKSKARVVSQRFINKMNFGFNLPTSRYEAKNNDI